MWRDWLDRGYTSGVRGSGGAPGLGVIGGGKKERPSLLPRRQKGLSGWALTGQASPDALPQSQATLQPALTWRPVEGVGGRGPWSACWAGLECVITLAGWGQWSSWQWGA